MAIVRKLLVVAVFICLVSYLLKLSGFSLSSILPSWWQQTVDKPVYHRPEYSELHDLSDHDLSDNKNIRPFKIPHLDESQVQDLKRKLNETTFFDSLHESYFEYGVNDVFLSKLREYWLNKYDWSKWVEILNQIFEHYKTNIGGLDVHYARRMAKGDNLAKKKPLILLHGWPGSIFEFYKIAPLLTDDDPTTSKNQLVFDVIAPSIPGYGWSDKPNKKGFSQLAAAHVFGHLMIKRLNFTQFYCQGGDWGSLICTLMAQLYPKNVLGIHLNMAPIPVHYPTVWFKLLIGYFTPGYVFDNADKYWSKVFPLRGHISNLLQESGYFHIQATKPDTIGFALLNSPMALAAFLCEKFSVWTNLNYRRLLEGGLINRQHFTLDELLTNVMIYYTTQTILTSQRFYKEFVRDEEVARFEKETVPANVAVGVAAFPHEPIKTAPKSLLIHKYPNLVLYQDMPRGGHFPALEEPALLAQSVRDFVCIIEKNC